MPLQQLAFSQIFPGERTESASLSDSLDVVVDNLDFHIQRLKYRDYPHYTQMASQDYPSLVVTLRSIAQAPLQKHDFFHVVKEEDPR